MLQTLNVKKLCILGDLGCGKSSLVLRYVKGQFFDYQVSQSSQQQPNVGSPGCGGGPGCLCWAEGLVCRARR
jgi:GTPase SAR1 family protein